MNQTELVEHQFAQNLDIYNKALCSRNEEGEPISFEDAAREIYQTVMSLNLMFAQYAPQDLENVDCSLLMDARQVFGQHLQAAKEYYAGQQIGIEWIA